MAERVERAVLVLFAAVLVWAPVPLGSNRPWAWSVLALLLGGLLLLWAAGRLMGGVPLAVPGAVKLAGLGLLGVVFWGVMQTLPAGDPAHLHPLRAVAEERGFATAPRIALDAHAGRDALMRLLAYAAAFSLAFALAQRTAAAKALGITLLAAGGTLALYGLVSHFLPLDFVVPGQDKLQYRRLHATFINPNNYATQANLGIVLGVGLLFEPFLRDLGHRGTKELAADLLKRLLGKRGLILLALLLLVTASLLTGSRGAFLSLGAALVAMLLLLFLATRPRGLRLGLGLAAIAGAVWGLVSLSGDLVLERFEHIDSSRGTMWSVTLAMVEDRPWLGHGYGSFQPAFETYRDERFPLFVDKAHNTYLEHAAELGLPATMALYLGPLLLVAFCLAGFFRRRRDRAYSLIAVSATILVGVHAVFDFSLQIPAVAVTFAALLGLGSAQAIPSARRHVARPGGSE